MTPFEHLTVILAVDVERIVIHQSPSAPNEHAEAGAGTGVGVAGGFGAVVVGGGVGVGVGVGVAGGLGAVVVGGGVGVGVGVGVAGGLGAVVGVEPGHALKSAKQCSPLIQSRSVADGHGVPHLELAFSQVVPHLNHVLLVTEEETGTGTCGAPISEL
jgi:hypothetical protein